MKWILLPGFDGTGILFAPFLAVLPPDVEPVVVAYPTDRNCSAEELVEIVLAHLPGSEPYVLIAESFSGPIALNAAARHQQPPMAVVLCASFVKCPLPRFPGAILGFCGGAVAGNRPPRWLVRRHLLDGATEEVVALFYRALGGVSSRVLAHRFSVLLNFEEGFVPPTLKFPLLYLQAGQDRLVKPRNFAIVQQRYPETHLERIESPHLVLQIQPEASLRAISEFLARLRSGAGASQHHVLPKHS